MRRSVVRGALVANQGIPGSLDEQASGDAAHVDGRGDDVSEVRRPLVLVDHLEGFVGKAEGLAGTDAGHEEDDLRAVLDRFRRDDLLRMRVVGDADLALYAVEFIARRLEAFGVRNGDVLDFLRARLPPLDKFNLGRWERSTDRGVAKLLGGGRLGALRAWSSLEVVRRLTDPSWNLPQPSCANRSQSLCSLSSQRCHA